MPARASCGLEEFSIFLLKIITTQKRFGRAWLGVRKRMRGLQPRFGAFWTLFVPPSWKWLRIFLSHASGWTMSIIWLLVFKWYRPCMIPFSYWCSQVHPFVSVQQASYYQHNCQTAEWNGSKWEKQGDRSRKHTTEKGNARNTERGRKTLGEREKNKRSEGAEGR